jgi:CRP/FNR family transcriptional regulator, anaerobic regulatory protein
MLMKTSPLHLQGPPHPQAEVCMGCEVRQHAVFKVLDDASLERLQAPIAAPSLAAEERIYARGHAGGAAFTVRSGIVRFERVTAGGDRRIVRLAGRGDFIGQEALLGQPYRDDAVACTPVALCRIPAMVLDEIGGGLDRLSRELMHRWQHALDDAENWSAELGAGPARRRVLRLVQLLQRHAEEEAGGGARIWLPRRDQMGDMLDMTMETASRVVSQLRREGVLRPVLPQHALLDGERLLQALRAADA